MKKTGDTNDLLYSLFVARVHGQRGGFVRGVLCMMLGLLIREERWLDNNDGIPDADSIDSFQRDRKW